MDSIDCRAVAQAPPISETSHIDVFEISVSVSDGDKAVQQFRDLLGLEPYFMAEGEMGGVILH